VVDRFLPLFPTQEGGEGWGEEEFHNSSLRLSPRSCLTGRERKESHFKLRFMGREQRAGLGALQMIVCQIPSPA